MTTQCWGVEVDTTGRLALIFLSGTVTITNTFVSGQGVTNSGELNSQQMRVDNTTRTVVGNQPNDTEVLYFSGLFQINRPYTVTVIASAENLRQSR